MVPLISSAADMAGMGSGQAPPVEVTVVGVVEIRQGMTVMKQVAVGVSPEDSCVAIVGMAGVTSTSRKKLVLSMEVWALVTGAAAGTAGGTTGFIEKVGMACVWTGVPAAAPRPSPVSSMVMGARGGVSVLPTDMGMYASVEQLGVGGIRQMGGGVEVWLAGSDTEVWVLAAADVAGVDLCSD